MNNLQPHELFGRSGALHLRELIGQDLRQFLTHMLIRQSYAQITSDDGQVPDCLAYMDHEIIFDTLLERLWPAIEQATNKKLFPTYSYARLYRNGNTLEKHLDRDECEISVTIQLGRSHHYAWPIYMGDKRYDLAEGDGVIYRGCEVPHWRNACDGPPGYYSGQVFLHFVDANGPHARLAGDNAQRKTYQGMFAQNRAFRMEQK